MDNNRDAVAAARAAMAFAAVLCAGLATSSTALGQQNDSLNVDVGKCVKLESPGERLDCYERQVQRAQAASPAPAAAALAPAAVSPAAAPPAVAPPPAAPSVAAPSPQRETSVRVEDARVANGTNSSEPVLSGTIVALREIVPNRWLVTLENGQIWRQTYAEPYPLRVGQRVEFSQTGRSRNSYQLAAVGMNGDIQVEPVR